MITIDSLQLIFNHKNQFIEIQIIKLKQKQPYHLYLVYGHHICDLFLVYGRHITTILEMTSDNLHISTCIVLN